MASSDTWFWLLLHFVVVWLKPLLVIGLSVWLVWHAYKRNKKRWVWKVLAIGLPAFLTLSIVHSNIELEMLCSRNAGVHVYGKTPSVTIVALDKYMINHSLFGVLQYLPEVEMEMTGARAHSMGVKEGFYRFSLAPSSKAECLSYGQNSRSLREGILNQRCLVATEISMLTSQYRITRALEPEDRTKPTDRTNSWRAPQDLYIVERESGETVAAARKYTRKQGWSWSGLDRTIPITFLVPSASLVGSHALTCPDRSFEELGDELYRSFFRNSPPLRLEQEDGLDPAQQ